MTKTAYRVERALLAGGLFKITSVVDTATQLPFKVNERNEFNLLDTEKN